MIENLSQREVRMIMAGEHVPRRPAKFASTLTSITITLPLPPKGVHSNARSRTWHKKARLTKEYRAQCTAIVRAAIPEYELPPMWKLAECQCTFYLERRRDHDGLLGWAKAAFDSLQGTVIANDSGLIHLPPKMVTAKEAKGERKVVLTITRRDS